MKSLLPLKITAGIALLPLILIALQHGAVDATVGTTAFALLLQFLLGVITHNDPPDDAPGGEKKVVP